MAVEAGVDTLVLNRTEGAFIHRVRTGLDGNRSSHRLSVGIGSKADAMHLHIFLLKEEALFPAMH